jgi:two-component system sensor histidine kinase KdpD
MRGVLRVYLGASPGVGKTFAMLDEGNRRKARGADVVVGFVETHGRPNTQRALGSLPVVPRRTVEYRGTTFEEMDLDAILERRPKVVLVDELAHTNSPGSRNEKRWEDVQEILNAGIEVITTVNIQHLESLSDVVLKVTGVPQRERVPDAFVRSADQIELVDMSPEALRKRMAHGNVYPLERVDRALENFFRLENLAAMRELALLWVADRVDDTLDRLRKVLNVEQGWETRERIVVAVKGDDFDEPLVRRAARIAERSRGELIAVHVRTHDGLRGASQQVAPGVASLITQLNSVLHEIDGDDIASAISAFALRQGATQIVLGTSTSRRSRIRTRPSIVTSVLGSAVSTDVHIIAREELGTKKTFRFSKRTSPLSRRRVGLGLAVVTFLLPLAILLMTLLKSSLTLASDLMLCLLIVVVAGLVGGPIAGISAAIVGFCLLNYFLVPPVHTFTVTEPQNLLALLVFLFVASTVSVYTYINARRTIEERRRRFEAETVARLVGILSSQPDPLVAAANEMVGVLGVSSVTISSVDATHVSTISSSQPADLTDELQANDTHTVKVVGPGLSVSDRRLFVQCVEQIGDYIKDQRLNQQREELRLTVEADNLRTSLLRAVSHDLRTPLANIKASVTSLLADDVQWSAERRSEFLHIVDDETNRLTRLVENLLDMSRLQAGKMVLNLARVHLDDLVAGALRSISESAAQVTVEIPDTLPEVFVDGDLLERAVANVVRNALAWSPPGEKVIIGGRYTGAGVELRIQDHGPGIPPSERKGALIPFQKLGDSVSSPNPTGVGLGLAVASGVCESMGASLELEDTPGGGLTVVMSLPIDTTERES